VLSSLVVYTSFFLISVLPV